jgi:hypothetical protein
LLRYWPERWFWQWLWILSFGESKCVSEGARERESHKRKGSLEVHVHRPLCPQRPVIISKLSHRVLSIIATQWILVEFGGWVQSQSSELSVSQRQLTT